MSKPKFFVHFQFLGIEPEFYSLPPETKIKANEEFLAALNNLTGHIAMATYSLVESRTDCDFMMMRLGEYLDPLQASFETLRTKGLGKFLEPAYTYLATSEVRPLSLGRLDYIFVCPWGRTREWNLLNPYEREKRLEEERMLVMRKPSLQLHIFDSFGMEGQEKILACETNQPRDFLEIVKDLKGTPTPYFVPTASTFLCLRKKTKDLLDATKKN